MAVDLGTYGLGRAAGEPAADGPAGGRGDGGRGGPRRDAGRTTGGRPARARIGRRSGLALALTAVLAADLAVLGVQAGESDRGPAAAVRALLAALAAGNGPAAAALVVPPAGPALLTAAAADADHAAPARITAVRRVGDTAAVDLHYATGSDGLLTLRRTAGDLFTPPRWRVVAGLPVLHVLAPSYGPVVLVDGHTFAAPLAAAGITVFPGRHQVGLPARSPAAALSVPVDAAGGRPTAVLQPAVDDATFAALSQAISYRVIPGGQAVEGPNSVHPSHVDIDTVTLAPDGRTLHFTAVLDMLIRVQIAYDTPTLTLTGTATVAGPVVLVTSLRRAPIGP